MIKSREKNFSTIIVTGKDHSETRSFTIQTKYIKHFTMYLITAGVFFCLLITTIISLIVYNKPQDTSSKILTLNQVGPINPPASIKKSANDAVQTQIYMDQIQTKLVKVNEYLKKRGVKGFSLNAVGGNKLKKTGVFTPNQKLVLFSEYITRLFNGLEFIPIGYPHTGEVTSIFGYRADPFEGSAGEFHAGMDLHGTTGEKVKSTASGKVIGAGWFQGYGNCVRIAHANGYQTLYGHLSEINVKAGQRVQAGNIIGFIGSTGHSTGPHLHYELRLNNKPINPNNFLTL